MIRIEVDAVEWAVQYELETDENITVKELAGYLKAVCGDKDAGIILSRELMGRLSDERHLKDYGVSSGDRLIYISCDSRKGEKNGTVKCGVCEDEGTAR